MIPDKGLFLDCNPIDQPEGTWRDARNVLVTKIKGAFTNEDGTSIISIPDVIVNSVPLSSYINIQYYPFGNIVLPGFPPSTTGYNWSIGVTATISATITQNNSSSDYLAGALAIADGQTYNIGYSFSISTGTASGVRIGFYKTGIGLLGSISLGSFATGSYSGTVALTATNNADYIVIRISGGSGATTWTVNALSTSITTVSTVPIGVKALPDGSKVVWSAGGTSRIGIIDKNDAYTDLIIDNVLGLSTSYPIRAAEVDYNFLQQRIIAWTDKYNPPRILNIDDLPFALDGTKKLVDSTNIIDANIFPTFSMPTFAFTVSQTGGSVRSGNYSVCAAYEDNNGTRTQNSVPIKNISIVDENTSVSFNNFDGVAPDTLTGKKINFTISNIDTHYDKLILIIVARRNNILTVSEVKKVNITSSVMNVTYVGNETETPVDLQQVLTPRPIYNKVGCMAQLNGKLYLADLETIADIEYQQYANQIRAFYVSKFIRVDSLTNSHKNVEPAGFAHGGVYALYITLLLTNGTKTRAFHIPGRKISSLESTPLATSTIGTAQGITGKKYQIEDTTNSYGHAYSNNGTYIRVTNMSIGSNMGYWENENEVYPTEFPDLAGQKVRHHVFPTIKKCKNYHYDDLGIDTRYANYGVTYMDILGLDITNVVIPDELKPFVQGWYISYAKREYSNSNTLGTDIFLTGHLSKGDSSHYSSAGGNWQTQSFEDGGGNWHTDFTPDPLRMRGHNFDLLLDKPNLGTSLYIDFEIKMRKNNLKARYQDVGKTGGNVAQSGDGEGQNAGAVIDLTDAANTIVSTVSTSTIRRVTEYKYLPTGIIDGNIRTIKNEEAIHLTLNSSTAGLYSPSTVHVNRDNRDPSPFIQQVSPFTNGGEETYLISYKQVKTDLYNDYDQQLLITTNQLIVGTDTQKTNIFGGDHFLSIRSFICSSQRYVDDTHATDGTTVIRAHISENRYNIGLRYEILGNVTTKYYPKTQPTNFWSNPSDVDEDGVTMIFDRNSNMNGVGMSPDYSAVNELNQSVIYNVNQVTTGQLPYRVIRSEFAGASQSSLNSWKTYLSADYYESNRNRGRIENIAVLDDTLLIHHLYGLFYTLGSQKLALGATEVFLGTSDIFSQVPKEPVSTRLGYLGCQNIFSTFSYKGTYAWADQSQGRIFTMSKQGVTEISNEGVYNFFRDNLRINVDLPNSPIVGQCIIGGFDPKYNRLLFTKKSTTGWFTLSYSINDKYWVCFHDYKPNMYFNSVDNLYALTSTGVHKMNMTTSKAKFFGATQVSSYIDQIFNSNKDKRKVFYNINWISELFSSVGVLLRNKTLSHLTAQNNFQNTGRIILVPHVDFNNKGNIRREGGKWNFNKVKDVNADPLRRRPLNSEYMLVRFEYDNAPNLDNTQNSLYLYLLSSEFRAG